MILFGDYHTHTIYSHGKGSILENAQIAKEKGLFEIAVTDHGFSHILYGANRKDLTKMHEEAKNAAEKTGVRVLVGIESNLISHNGDIDVQPFDLDNLDILICGFHSFAKGKPISQQFTLMGRNSVSSIWKPTQRTIEKNTDAYLKMLDKYPVDIISHLNSRCQTNTLSVAKAARDKGTYIELNSRRICFTAEEMEAMVAEKVKFVLSSDAHIPQNVGECNLGLNFALKHKIPTELIANLDKLPSFHKENR